MSRWVRVVALCLVALPSFATLSLAGGLPFDETRGVFTLAAVLEARAPGVVNIVASGTAKAQPRTVGTQPRRGTSEGSGVIVDAAKGYVMTNHHVVAGANSINVTTTDGRTFEARFIGSDPDTDIAVLRIAPQDLVAVPFGDVQTLRVGDFVLAIGNPYGLGQSVTTGIISALGRGGFEAEGFEDYIQTDASINPGNSGGALIDTQGRLIGINAAIYGPPGGGTANGIGFAVPVDIARAVMNQLVQYGDIKKGRLGANLADLSPAQVTRIGATGAQVRNVDGASPAERGGLIANDVVLSLDGRTVRNARDLMNKVALTRAGSNVQLTVLRAGTTLTMTIGLEEAFAL